MQGKFTIVTKEYRQALHLLSVAFRERDIDYAIIGGGAVQLHIGSVVDAIELEKHLRRTGDIDVAVNADLSEMVEMFNELALSHKRVSNLAFGTAIINGVYISYFVPRELKGFENYHDLVLRESSPIEIKIRNTPLKVQVENPEMIVAAKLTGDLKLKDVFDIKQLYSILNPRGKFNEKKLLELLQQFGREDKIQTFYSIVEA